MQKNGRSFCPATWFSGFFGLGVVVHLVRLIFRVPVTLGTWAVPLGFSIGMVVLFGALSLGFLAVACKRPCCSAQ